MAKDEMILINMSFNSSHLDKVLNKLMDVHQFYPQKASDIVFSEEVGFLQEDKSYDDLILRLKHIASDLKLELSETQHDDTLDIKKTEIYLNGLEREIRKILDVSDQLKKEKHENELTLGMLKSIHTNDINLDKLNQCQYVTMRLGRLDKKNKKELQYLDKYPAVYYELGSDKNDIWGCYIVVNSYLLEVDNFFQALGFEKIELPDFVHGEIDDAKVELENEVEAMQSYILNMDLKMDQLKIAHKDELLKLYTTASFLSKKEAYKVYVIDFKSHYSVYGFTPDVQELKKHFKGIDSIEYQILPSDILEQHQIYAPKTIHNDKFIEPFELLSQPKPDSIDITSAYAYLYYSVFALFFGDLGIGVLMTLIGFLLRGRKNGRLLLALGVATVLGGLLYGRVFYFINIYPALIGFRTIFRIIDGLVLIVVGTLAIRFFKEKLEFVNRLSKQGKWVIALIYIVIVYLLSLIEAKIHLPLIPFAIVAVVLLELVLKFIFQKKR